MSNLFDKAQGLALDMAVNYVLKDPAHNMPRLLDVVETLDVTGGWAQQLVTADTAKAEMEEASW